MNETNSSNLHSQTPQGVSSGRHILHALADPFSIVTFVIYVLALIGLAFHPSSLWSALLLGFGAALLSAIVLAATRGRVLQPVTVIQPQAELWSALIWYGMVVLLAALTSARGLELVNEFTNWFFLVIMPLGLLVLVRRRGLTLRTTLRSIGLTRTGLKNALKLAILTGVLFVPVLYVVSPQQQAAIQMFLHEPMRAVMAFLLSFVLALLTAGFVEEFFFRGVLQTRAAAYLGSEWRGLLVASLLFGVLHLPMYFFSPFEPTHGNFVWALSSCIAELGITGIVLGTLWARTHNLAASVLVHALINAFAMMSVLKIGIG